MEYTTEQRKRMEENGFRLNAAGKIIDNNGHLVPQSQVDHILSGSIIAGFDIESLRKSRARAAANGTANLVESLRAIAPQIEHLKVGQTAKIAMPKESANGKDPVRQFVMSIVTKLNNLTVKGREWAGRKFDAISDENKEFFYVTRLEDGEAKERKAGAGRKARVATSKLDEAMAAAAEKLDEDNVEAENEDLIEEEAVLIQH